MAVVRGLIVASFALRKFFAEHGGQRAGDGGAGDGDPVDLAGREQTGDFLIGLGDVAAGVDDDLLDVAAGGY